MNVNVVSFAVPYGVDVITRLLVSAERADRGRGYLCPICDSLLVLRQGDFRVWHFAHRPGFYDRCGSSLAKNMVAKRLMYQSLALCPGRVFFAVNSDCRHKEPVFYKLIDGYSYLQQDHYFSGCRYDVLLYNNRLEPIFALMVANDDAISRPSFFESAVPILEFNTVDVLANPFVLPPPVFWRGRPRGWELGYSCFCVRCRQAHDDRYFEHVRKLHYVSQMDARMGRVNRVSVGFGRSVEPLQKYVSKDRDGTDKTRGKLRLAELNMSFRSA